jgi:chitinase
MHRRRPIAVLAFFLALAVAGICADAASAAEWAPNVSYSVGAIVTYSGSTYRCQQAHTSLVGWEPANTPALWTLQQGGTPTPTTPPTATPRPTATPTPGGTATPTPTPRPGATSFEAEAGTVTGAARRRTCGACSGGQKVGSIGNGSGNAVTLTVSANSGGARTMNIFYLVSGTRTLFYSVNGGPASSVTVSGSSFSTVAPPRAVTVTLNAGSNSVRVFNNSAFAPDLDRVTIGAGTGTPTPTPTPGPTATPRPRPTATPTVAPTPTPCTNCGGNIPRHAIVGYWHNFDNGSGFIKLRDVSSQFDVIQVAFAEPTSVSSGDIRFVPDSRTSEAEIKSDIQILHGRGKKVLISIGGANGQVVLNSATARTSFVNSVTSIIRNYGFDGLDIDFEGHSLSIDANDADFRNPTTAVITNLISAIRQIKGNIGGNFVLTMAPETFFVQLGYQFYGGTTCGSCDRRAGAYLPVIHALRNDITILHVQHYNSGPIMGLDNQYHFMGSADFHVAMADMMLTGFPVANTGFTFPPLRQDQVAIGLPANVNAGGGFTPVGEVRTALNYLYRGQAFGSYRLRGASSYPNMRGLMTWSINWDRFNNFEFSTQHGAYLDALP